MKNRLGWPLATLAILTFSFGQASAAAGQILPSEAANVTVPQTNATVKTATAVVKPTPAKKAAAAKSAPVKAAAALAPDETKVPHYFGPYPNWAWSPQVLSNAVVSIAAPPSVAGVASGNPLINRAMPTDMSSQIFVVLPNAKLIAGTLKSFQTWNQTLMGNSAGQVFHAYVLRPTPGTPNGYLVVYESGALTVPVATVATGEVSTFAVSPGVTVAADDVIGFYGQGIPFDIGAASDTLSYPAPVAPTLDSTMTENVDPGFPIYPQNREYSFGATVAAGTTAEATATVDPKTGGITAYTVTNPGSGYAVPPAVTITAPGVTITSPATGTSAISTGALTSIAVNEAGYGFTTPTVTITGGTPTTPATAQANGGVDNLTIAAGGSSYTVQPIVSFSLPDAPRCLTTPAPVPACQMPTASATMTAAGVVDTVTLVTPGDGYIKAPTVTIKDGATANPTPATIDATIQIGQIDILTPGAGYTSVPTVTITDSVAPFDKLATATATIAAAGAVSSIAATAPGAGYLTPGLKKFVDTLSGLGSKASAVGLPGKNNLGNYIPVAVPDTKTYPGTDYYEIAVVQYRQKFASSLPATLQRGYVQLSTATVPGAQVPLTNASLVPGANFTAASTTWASTPAMLPAVGTAAPVQALGVDKPNSLGPTIVASKDKPVRVLFRNLLPTGVAGDLFLPVDTSLMGSGQGPNGMTLNPTTKVPVDMNPDMGVVTDMVRNPACGETAFDAVLGTWSRQAKPLTCYTENRATLHNHGGVTPWISDGTPHQWITPAGETTDYPEGVSVSNVPDMADPGPGAETFFYTNQQSARLQFYHDHAWGITRLNVYAGEAAPYLITDLTETKLTSAGGALEGLGLGTPLIVQDKTFVSKDIANTDPTWDAAKWGGEGSLWLPHVYMPAQNPGDPSGSSVFGRWMYGPWFWPPAKDAKYPPIANPYYDAACVASPTQFCEPPQIPSTPNVSVGMEAFNDTPIVNGTAYPTTTVDPQAYRYRILNAANDRMWNLQWYVADPTTGTLSEVAFKAADVAAAQTDPNVVPTPDLTKSPAGPNFIQIGTEGGFLPTPTIVPNQPITWITDPTRFDWGNVDKHALLLAPAERADVIVDFSQYRGKTLILYNDSPAAFPARQASYDMYTGGPDFSPAGPHPTLPGYGPNTRTIMQVKVSTAAPAVAFDRPNTTADRMGALMTAFGHKADKSGVFESGSDPIIVGQAAYNTAYGTNFTTNGWCTSPTLPAAKCDGFARIQQQGGDLFKFDTLGPLKNGLGTQLSIPLQPKGIHDEANSANFDPWGRMSANMGLEAPGATPLLQNIILYPFTNPATEVLDATSVDLPDALNVTPISSAADGTQIWKITHNGVDTHPLHWHLYNVQVINRVTWDNIIMPPEPSELGWKETVRVSPLEDTYVAVRPIVPTLPFGVPDSKRLLNPAMPLGATGAVTPLNATGDQAGFNNTDANGSPMITPIANTVVNFGWEYVWHCHMLSHEEMDMMRPVTVDVARALPLAPNPVTVTGTTLNWKDTTPVTAADMANPASWTLTGAAKGTAEIGFRIERATISSVGVVSAFTTIATALANTTTYTDASADATKQYMYRVVAFNAAGDAVSSNVQVGPSAGFTAKVPSTRVLDTSAGIGAPKAKLGAAKTLTLTVPGVPAGATSVALNVTVSGPTAASYLAVYPNGQARPAGASLNYPSGAIISNMVVVPLGPLDTVTFYNNAGTVNVIADLAGSYGPATGAGFTGKALTRVMDTRSGLGPVPVAKVGAGRTVTLTVPGLPAGATSVALNVTATTPTAASYLTVYAGGTARPATSNLNYASGQTISNTVLVPLGTGNTVTFYNSAGTVDVLADVAGSFGTGGVGFTGRLLPRVLDTRTGIGAPVAKLGAGGTLTLTVPGLPAGATSVALNLTVTAPTAAAFMTVYPNGQSRPSGANLNYVSAQTISNLVLVPVGPGGTVTIYNSAGTVNVIADLVGYFN